MGLKSHLARGLRATLVAQFVHMAASGLLIILLARYLLSQEEYGLLFLAISIITVAQLFSDLGIAKSGARFLAEYRESDPSLVRPVLTASLKYRLISITIVGLGLGVFANVMADILGEPGLVPLLYAGIAYLAAHSLSTFAGLLFQGFNRVTWTAKVKIVSGVTRPLFVAAFVLAGWGAVGAIVGYAVSFGLGALIGLVVLYRYFYGASPPASENTDIGGRIIRYSVPLAATRGANVLDKHIDTILIGFFLNPLAVGFYTLGKQINAFLLGPARSLGFTISPTFGEQKARDELDRAARVYETALEHTLLLYVPAAAGVIVVAEPAVRIIFGEGWLGAVPVVQILSGFLLLQAVTNVTSDGIDYLGRARFRAIAKGVTSIGNFVLNVLLIPRFGVVGAASATVVTHSVYVLLNLYIINQEFSLSVTSLVKKTTLIVLISLGMALTVGTLLPYVSGLFFLIAVICVGVLTWGGLATVSGLLDVRQIYSVLTS